MNCWRRARKAWPKSRKTAFYQMLDHYAHRKHADLANVPNNMTWLDRRLCDAFDYHIACGIVGRSLLGRKGNDKNLKNWGTVADARIVDR